MIVNGVAELLSSEVTRDLELSCGLLLKFKKMRWKQYAQRETYIVSKRQDPKNTALQMCEVLAELKRDDTDIIIEALMDMVQRSSYAYFDEMVAYETSATGKAYDLHLCTDLPFEDCYVLLEAKLSEEDRTKLDEAIAWCKELPPLKNVDGPSQETNQNLSYEVGTVYSEAGENSFATRNREHDSLFYVGCNGSCSLPRNGGFLTVV